MHKMVTKESIRKQHFREGWSIRKIARETGRSRQYIREALKDADVPKYKPRARQPMPVMKDYIEVISEWLEQDKHAPKKQRHTARRIYDRLVAEYDFRGAQSTVRRTVGALRAVPSEAYIPQDAGYGEEAQVDFGQATILLNGKESKVHLFCLRLRASKVPFVYAYRSEKMECFLDGHVRAFTDLGVPLRCRYDNASITVKKLLGGPERQETNLFSSLRAHYLFDSEFCNPAKGNEKGAVENLVGYCRRNTLVPVPDVASLDELNAILAAWCEREKHRLSDDWEQEKAALRPANDGFRACISTAVLVDKLCLVSHLRVKYSAPSEFVGRVLRLDAYPERVDLCDQGRLLASHPRSFQRGDFVMDFRHYLGPLEQKMRAASRAKFLRSMPEAFIRARNELGLRQAGYKEFARILLLAREFALEDLTVALEKALDMGRPTATVVRQLLLSKVRGPAHTIQVPERLQLTLPTPNLNQYDLLIKEAGQ